MDSIELDDNSARQYLDRRLQENDVKGAIEFAIKGQNKFPTLKRLLRFLANIVVQVSAEDEEIDWYTVLGVDPSADTKTVQEHYVKLAKKNSLGSLEAYKLLDKAWNILSDKYTRRDYDLRRSSREVQPNAFVVEQARSATELLHPAPVLHDVPGNNRSGLRLVVSTATNRIEPVPGPCNIGNNKTHLTSDSAAKKLTQPGNNGRGLTTIPSDAHLIQPPEDQYNVSGYKGSGPRLVSSPPRSIQLGPGKYNLLGNRENGPMLVSSTTQSIQTAPGTYSVSGHIGSVPRLGFSAAQSIQPAPGIVSGNIGSGPRLVPSARPLIQPAPGMHNVSEQNGSIPGSVSQSTQSLPPTPGLCDGSGNNGSGVAIVSSAAQSIQSARVNLKRRYEGEDQTSASRAKAPCIHFKESGIGLPPVAGSISRKGKSKYKWSDEDKNILMYKARKVILDKLNECKAAARDDNKHNPADDREIVATEGSKEHRLKTMEVPDSEFHNFDKDRTEESFAEKQVWAVYDEDDGMPRLYALIRKASERPFKLQLSWLNSESCVEPESIKWINSGFHKTCGDFYAEKEKISIELNSFSHRVVGWTKAANVFQIFPKKGDVWALYSNWSPKWNVHTTEEEKHKYEMVEVLEDYDEEKGVAIVPLVKVSGYKAVFCQHSDTKEVRTVPKEEIFRFSHQVSSYLLTDQEAPNLPKGSKELDPAAMPLELLQVIH